MQLGSQWIVELAARESQARVRRWSEEHSREEGVTDLGRTASLGRRCLALGGHLLLVVGAWLSRQAGEVYRVDGGVEAVRDRRVEQGAAPRI